MKKTYYLLIISLFLCSCSALKSGNFNKRKFLNLKSSNPREKVIEEDETTLQEEEPNLNLEQTTEWTEPSAFQAEESFSKDEFSTQSIPELVLMEDVSDYESEHEVDDSLTQSGEDPKLFAIRDQEKIMEPNFKWVKAMFVLALILAAALTVLFFTIAAGFLVELLYVLLIFKGLFTIVGVASGIRARLSAKKLQGLTDEQEKVDKAKKVRKVAAVLLTIMIAIPILGLLGLVLYNNV